MKIFTTLLTVALLASCANTNTKSHIRNIEAQITITDQGEDFNSFYKYYVIDSIFQTERVLFPFDLVINHIDASGMEMDSVIHFADKGEWEYLHMPDHKDSNKSIQELTFNSDSTKSDLKILGDGATVNTSFIRENGKWYLSSYTASAGGYKW